MLSPDAAVPVADDLRSHLIGECGHIIPMDRPGDLLNLLLDFLGE